MRTTLLATVAALLLLPLAPSTLAEDASVDGTILAGHPAALFGVGAGELVAACDSTATLQGVDAAWLPLADPATLRSFRLEPAATLDADVFFFDDECDFIDTYRGAAQLAGLPESGPLPPRSAFALVVGSAGSGAFRFQTSAQEAPPVAWEAPYAPIQPGAPFMRGDTEHHCSLNYVFRDAQGLLYVGTAGHCADGPRPRIPNGPTFGTLVYRNNSAGMDIGIFRIDEDKYDLVNPAMRFWGGPLAVETAFEKGSPLLHYGNGVAFTPSLAMRARAGVLTNVQSEEFWGSARGWYVATLAVVGGDSGSSVLMANGNALGVAAEIAPGSKGTMTGPTIELVLDVLARDGFPLELVTAPFSFADAPEKVSAFVAQCTMRPIEKFAPGDGCVTPLRPDDGVPRPGTLL